MDNSRLLVVAMAEKCASLIARSNAPDPNLPKALHPKHLLWMCKQVAEHAENGSVTKLHRWVGFIQGAMLANRMLSLDELKAMFDQAKIAYTDSGEDLNDHLDVESSFHLDIGGEG